MFGGSYYVFASTMLQNAGVPAHAGKLCILEKFVDMVGDAMMKKVRNMFVKVDTNDSLMKSLFLQVSSKCGFKDEARDSWMDFLEQNDIDHGIEMLLYECEEQTDFFENEMLKIKENGVLNIKSQKTMVEDKLYKTYGALAGFFFVFSALFGTLTYLDRDVAPIFLICWKSRQSFFCFFLCFLCFDRV
jgi:hypothetical protein